MTLTDFGLKNPISVPTTFITKDSGKRVDFDSGMKRDTQEGKPRYDLIYAPELKQWAELMARGAEKYGENNWQKANSVEELNRFKASAWRHFMQFMEGEETECHSAAIYFNISACRFIMAKLGVDIYGQKRVPETVLPKE